MLFHDRFTRPRKESNLLDRTSEILLKVSQRISSNNTGLSLRSGLVDIFSSRAVRKKCPWLPEPKCDPGQKYRQLDGTCNNLRHPNYGRLGTPFQRILLPDYGQGSLEVPRKRAGDNFELPPARRVSNTLAGGANKRDQARSLLLMQFGQFIDHDITHTPAYESADCCKENKDFPTSFNAEKCYPIRVADQDPFWRGGLTCMDFSRSLSSPDLDCKLNNREQTNQVEL